MNVYDAAEQAYKRGYEQGKKDSRKKGRWEKVYTCSGEWLWGYRCDQCKGEHGKKSNYCPNCGADMK